jgi:hypothetical protein
MREVAWYPGSPFRYAAMFPECPLNVPWMFPKYFPNVREKFPEKFFFFFDAHPEKAHGSLEHHEGGGAVPRVPLQIREAPPRLPRGALGGAHKVHVEEARAPQVLRRALPRGRQLKCAQQR